MVDVDADKVHRLDRRGLLRRPLNYRHGSSRGLFGDAVKELLSPLEGDWVVVPHRWNMASIYTQNIPISYEVIILISMKYSY